MKSKQTLSHLITHLWQHLSQRRRRQFGLLLILMIFTSFAEIVSIGAILPFLTVITSPERVFGHPLAQPVIQMFGLTRPQQLLLPLAIGFAFSALLAGVMRLSMLYANIRLSFATGADLGINIYRRTLFQPYAVHVARNSSEIITGVTNKTNSLIGNILMPILTLISSTLMLFAILTTLFIVNPVVALVAICGFGAIYGFIIHVTRSRLSSNSKLIARKSTLVLKSLQEGLGGIRDVLIDGSQDTYCQIYRNADLPLRRAIGNNKFITESPRYAMEAMGMGLIAALAYVLTDQPQGMATAIPILGALALGAQRLLPVLQHGYASLSIMTGSQAALQDTLHLLDQPLPEYANQQAPVPIPFQQGISINNLSFRYSPDSPWVLRDVELTIPKGSRTGFIGTTGGGKSTLLDIIMALLVPTEGTLAIDGQVITPDNYRTWQAHIAHVPQAIYLADTSIEENIAFGLPKDQIDPERVRFAARRAQIADLIESWPQQYKTFIGERGIRLSGGQRQRIGIARALYKQADVIIFDEATSALDSKTEQAIMESIDSLDKDLTILIVTHRLSTLKNCDHIIEIQNGGINQLGNDQLQKH